MRSETKQALRTLAHVCEEANYVCSKCELGIDGECLLEEKPGLVGVPDEDD